MKRLILALFAGFLFLPATLFAQRPAQQPPSLALPECDIFLFDLVDRDGAVQLKNGRNITNRPGYDNQPWFTPNSRSILFSANGQPDRTDIFEYHIDSEETRQVTDTPTQEYSPQISPDNRTLSFVSDGETANQSIWTTRRESPQESWLLQQQGQREPVGYYSWNHETGDILYWSRYGFSLTLVRSSENSSHYVTGNAPPSSPHIIPGSRKFSFLHRQGNGEVWIKELDPESRAIRPLTVVIGNSRNYAWTPDGHILMADDDRLYLWSPESDDGWKQVANLEELGVRDVTRLNVSPDGLRLALVGLPDGQ